MKPLTAEEIERCNNLDVSKWTTGPFDEFYDYVERIARKRGEWKEPPRLLRGPEFYETGEWQLLRRKTIMRYGNRCMCCGWRGSSQNPIQVDHVKPRSRYPEFELSLDNLQVLCRDCNMAKGTGETDYRRGH